MTSIAVKVLIAIALAIALFGMKSLYDNHQQSIGAAAQYKVDQAEADRLKAAAAEQLATLKGEKEAADRAFVAYKTAQDIQYVQTQKKLGNLSAQLRDLGQLRDPYAQASGCGSGSGGTETKEAGATAVGADNRTKTTGLLSAELTRFLWQKDADADAINAAYSDCRAALQNLQTSPAFSQ